MAKKSRRTKVGRFYVRRRKDGTFQNWVSIGRSLAADRRKKAKAVKPGQGDKGDVFKRRRFFNF